MKVRMQKLELGNEKIQKLESENVTLRQHITKLKEKLDAIANKLFEEYEWKCEPKQ